LEIEFEELGVKTSAREVSSKTTGISLDDQFYTTKPLDQIILSDGQEKQKVVFNETGL
jgi:hypothetical protein